MRPARLNEGLLPPVALPAEDVEPLSTGETSSFERRDPQLDNSSLIDLPEPSFYPAAVPAQTSFGRTARLQRGNQVFEISNDAFRKSGILETAIRETPELARAFSNYEKSAMQAEKLRFEGQAAVNAQQIEADTPEWKAIAGTINEAQLTQQTAASNFEAVLWERGFNGSKVAAVSSTINSGSSLKSGGYVLVDSIGAFGAENFGYSYTTITSYGEIGATYVPSEYLLPLPQDPNDLFYRQADSAYTQRAPDGWMLMLTDDKSINPIVQALANARFGITHDTGFLGDAKLGSFAERVDLKSRRANGAGQSDFLFDSGQGKEQIMLPIDAALNLQVLDLGGGTTGQLFYTGNNDFDRDSFRTETFGFRAYLRESGSPFEGWSLVAGKKQSLFGAIDLRPQGLNGARSLVGTVDAQGNRSQLAVGGPLTNLVSLNMAVEDPTVVDYLYSGLGANDVTVLKRWPTIAGNLTLTSPVTDEKLVLGALYRPIAYEVNTSRAEQFANAWGLNAIAKLNFYNGTNFVGVAGGNGVGDYIRGINNSVVGSRTAIETIYGYGAFAGRQVVLRDENNVPTSEFNFAYGYGMMENPSTFAGPTNRKYHQFWGNYFKYFGDRFGVGTEYQYGFREDSTGDVGENHAISFLLALRTQKPQTTTRVAEYISPAEQSTPSSFEPGAVPESGYASAGTTLDGQSIRSVVQQSQIGGPAFRQGL